MRQQLIEAAKACGPTTFRDADHQVDFLRRLAVSVAAEFERLVEVEVTGRGVVVTFSAATGPQAA
ncbi:MAG: hypothetical protein WA864_09765 [Acetobacteraceae bacterium]